MSRDIFVQDLPRNAKRTADIPEDFRPRAIGKRAEIIAKIHEVVPGADFSDPAWGTIDGADWSIEINMGEEEVCRGFAFHVRGDGAAPHVIAAILEHLGLRALDPSQPGGFFEAGPQARASFARWRAFRDQVVIRRPPDRE